MKKTVAEIIRVGCYALTRDGVPLGHIAVLPFHNGWRAHCVGIHCGRAVLTKRCLRCAHKAGWIG